MVLLYKDKKYFGPPLDFSVLRSDRSTRRKGKVLRINRLLISVAIAGGYLERKCSTQLRSAFLIIATLDSLLPIPFTNRFYFLLHYEKRSLYKVRRNDMYVQASTE